MIDALVLLLAAALALSVAVPEVSAARRRSVESVMRSELRQLAAVEESYFYDHRVYGADLSALPAGLSPGSGVRIVVNEATQLGWSATASHAETPARCFLFVRGAAPVGAASTPGEIRCS